ncbi:MAG: HAD-IA family hydrolase [Acidobacteriota bacterium]
MKDVRAILFDAGGTLIHIDGERVCSAAGLPFDPEGFRRAESSAVSAVREFVLQNPGSRDAQRLPLYLESMLEALGIAAPKDLSEAARRVGDEHQRANLWSRASPRAAETLAALRGRNYRIAVISNADGRVRTLLEGAGLSPWLEFILDSAEVGIEKPDPRIFHAATNRLRLPPAACAYVGDIYEIDVAGAQGAGLRPVLIGDGHAPESVLRVPDLWSLLNLFPGAGQNPSYTVS